MTPTPLCKLVEDTSIYPRHAIDDANVSSLVNALRVGAALPPVIADAKSLRIVDGWHRVRAYRRVLGPEASIDVDLRKYTNEDAILLDAIRLNAAHGRRFDVIDQVRAAAMCQERGIEIKHIAAVLNVPEDRVQKLTVRLASAPKSGPGTITGTTKVALKRPVIHLQGTEFTSAQVKAHESAPGTSYLLLCKQLLDALNCDFINRSDGRLLDALSALHKALSDFLLARAA